MAKSYTSEEVQTAVSRLLRTSIRRQYGALGNRRTNITFSDIQDAAAGVFCLKANAPYYVVVLACRLLDSLVEDAENTLEGLIDSVRSLGRRVHPVEQLSPLANARTALGALSGATASRTTSLTRVEDVPAFRRFEQSTSLFLRSSGKTVLSGGEIVQTPQEARAGLGALISSLKEQHEQLLTRAHYIEAALDDFDNLQLPSQLSSSVIQNSEEVIGGRYDELNALTPEERLGVMREVVLDVLATRAAVKGFGSLEPTVSFVYLDGWSGVHASTSHPAVSAFTVSDNPGPITILDDTGLDLLVDGTHAISVDLPRSYVAFVETFIMENYGIGSTPGSENNKLFIDVTGFSRVSATFADNVATTAKGIADQINAAIGGQPIVSEPYGGQLYFQGAVADLVVIAGTVTEFTSVGNDWSSIPGFTVALGDWVEVVDSSVPGNSVWYKVSNIAGLPTVFNALREGGAGGGDEAGVTLNINRGPRGVRVRYTEGYSPTAVANRESISIPTDSDSIVVSAQATLGFLPAITVQCEPTRVADMVKFINDNPAVAPGGTGRVRASTDFVPSIVGRVRTNPADATLATFSLHESVCDIGNAGANTFFTNFASSPEALGTGCVIVIRESSHEGEISNWGVVYSNAGGVVAAHMNVAVGVVETGVSVEFGPDLRAFSFPGTLKVENAPPDLNDGSYEVLGLEGTVLTPGGPLVTPIGCVLARTFPVSSALGYQSVYFQGALGEDYLRLTSESTLTNTAVEVLASGSAASLLWSSLPVAEVGATEWLSAPEALSRVAVGDYVELSETEESSPTQVLEVLRTGTLPDVMQVTPLLPTSAGPWDMRQGAPPFHGRIRKLRRDTFDVLQVSLQLWLEAQTNNINVYYGELRRLLNPLSVNKNPQASAISAVVFHLQDLRVSFTQARLYLQSYVAPRVEEVDVLISTYLQHGAQKAVDTLVAGRFSAFFGLTQENASYTGAVQQLVREVSMRDLPQRKAGRNPGGESIDSYEDIDYEFNLSDVEGEEDVPVPGEVSEYEDSAF